MTLTPLFSRTALIGVALLALSACGSKDAQSGGNSVTMRNMDVVDGTTSDAMTDLDGTRAEGTALVEPAVSNASGNAAAPAPAAGQDDSEVVADQ